VAVGEERKALELGGPLPVQAREELGRHRDPLVEGDGRAVEVPGHRLDHQLASDAEVLEQHPLEREPAASRVDLGRREGLGGDDAHLHQAVERRAGAGHGAITVLGQRGIGRP